MGYIKRLDPARLCLNASYMQYSRVSVVFLQIAHPPFEDLCVSCSGYGQSSTFFAAL